MLIKMNKKRYLECPITLDELMELYNLIENYFEHSLKEEN